LIRIDKGKKTVKAKGVGLSNSGEGRRTADRRQSMAAKP